MLSACRVKEWAKNIFVFFCLLYALQPQNIDLLPANLMRLTLVAAAFSLAASSVYLVNDISDREKDRMHNKKRYRAIASGLISVRLATIMVVVLTASSLFIASYLGWTIAAIIAAYLGISHLYTLVFKHMAVIDIVFVASLYGLRALAGFVAISLFGTNWFLWIAVATISAFILELGKRKGEFGIYGANAATRKALKYYTLPLMERMFRGSLAILLAVYTTASFSISPVFVISTIAVGMGLNAFWNAYNEDVPPQKILFGNKSLRPFMGLAAVVYLPVLFR